MPSNQLSLHGAQPSRQTRYAPLFEARFFEGVFSQQSPFGGGNANHLEIAYYGPRNSKLLADSVNAEVSSSLTMIRRPGMSIYNSQTFPACNRMYENRVSVYNSTQTQLNESIQVIYDGQDGNIYDATGPSTKKVLFAKAAGAGKTFFQSVGNSLYFSDGPDQKKLITPSKVWGANQTFQSGDLITDSNGNIQEVTPSYSLNIATVQIVVHSIVHVPPVTSYYAIVTFTGEVKWPLGTLVTFNGLTNYTALNGLTLPTVAPFGPVPTNQVIVAAPTSVIYGPIADTGTATSGSATGTFVSGAIQPTWNVVLGGTTTDGTVVWQNFGGPVYNWADPAPTSPPTLISNPATRQWSPLTTIPANYSILDVNNHVQYAYGAVIPQTTGSTQPVWGANVPTLTTGLSGAIFTIPGAATQDGSVLWTNCGTPIAWTPSTNLPTSQVLLDSNGNWQILISSTDTTYGVTGATMPVWNTTLYGNTTDGTITWINVGPGSVLITGNVQYAYSLHSIDGSVTTASPIVLQNVNTSVVGPAGAYRALLYGPNSTDSQIDQIWLWRTVQGGSVLVFLDALPNPSVGASATWIYTDYLPDTSLDSLIEAPINHANDPPPVGITALTYHLGRVWGAVGNIVYNSEGPDVTAGNGNTAWSPADVNIYPSSITRLDPTSYGLTIYTLSDPYLIQGLGTVASEFISTPFLTYLGLVSYDAFTKNGGITLFYTSDNQLVSLDPNGGVSEVGFPIGDQFGPGNGTGTFTPSTTQVTWHVSGSQDKGLYVSDGQGTWWRLCPTPSPETGMTWSPKAQPIGGFSCIQSVETTPGTHNLLVAPKTSGPILKRDSSVYTDNGQPYNAYFVLGSLVLAQPGQVAMVESITLDSWLRGTAPTLAVQLDEIAPLSAGLFEPLTSYVPDPPTLYAPVSLYAQRFYLSQTQDAAWCRHLQIQVLWGFDSLRMNYLA